MNIFARIQSRLLEGIWGQVQRTPRLVVAAALILSLAATVAAVFFLHLDSDQDKLVSESLPYQKRFLETLENFGDQEYLYVVIETDGSSRQRSQAERFAQRMAARLQDHPELILQIHYRITADDLGNKALYFMPVDEARRLVDGVVALGPAAVDWVRDGRLSRLFDQIAQLLGGQAAGTGTAPSPSLIGPALEKLGDFLKKVEKARSGQAVEGPHFDLLEGDSQYFFTEDGRLLVMRLLPAKDFGTMDVVAAPLATVRQALAETRKEFPALQAGVTGRPALQADEMSTTNRDMTRASVIAVILVGLLFMVVLHGVLRPLLVLGCLVMAIAWTFGFTAVTIGVLNLLSIVFALVLVGIGVDFGIHVVLRYVEERKEGQGVEAAVHSALTRTGPGIILGALTSVCAFYSVLGSDFQGLAELGLIGGTGILFCLLAMLIVLPALLLIAGRKNLFSESSPTLIHLPWLEKISDRPAILLTVLAIITLGLAPGMFKTRFSYNLLDLQARGLESVQYEHLMIESSSESTWYAISVAEDLQQVARLREQFLALPTVGKIESLLDLLPDQQTRKKELFAKAASSLEPWPDKLLESPPPEAASLLSSLERLRESLEGLEEKLFVAGAGQELSSLAKVFFSINKISQGLAADPTSAERLTALQKQTRSEVVDAIQRLHSWFRAEPVTMEDLPRAMKDIYVGRDGRMQVKVIPRDNIWEFDKLKQFLQELRSVDPHISGAPVSVFESSLLMRRTFLSAASLTLVLVILLLWLNTRSLLQVLLTLLPLGVGMIWLLSLMGWLGLDFNLANFFAIPILIAIGVDGGIHFLARWRGLGDERLFSTSTPVAVTLSFATSAIGFGGLLLAHHRGLASLGAVMVIGSLTGMLSCLLVLPAVLKLIDGKWDSALKKEDGGE